MEKTTFTDVLSVIIALIGAAFFGAAFLGCYILLAQDFSWYNLVGTVFASAIPGFLCHGILLAVIEFLSGKSSQKKRVKTITCNNTVKNVFTLIIALIAIVLFGGTVVYFFTVAIKALSFASILAAFLASFIPAIICCSCTVATVDFVRDEFFSKKGKKA